MEKSAIISKPLGSTVADRMVRNKSIVSQVIELIERWKPECCCIESYSMGSMSGQAWSRIEFGGLLRYAIVWEKVPIYEVAPLTLKKFATGSGKGEGKTGVIVGLTRRYGIELETDDEYDAYALARIAMQIAKFETSATDYQSECIQTITVPKVKVTKKKRFAP